MNNKNLGGLTIKSSGWGHFDLVLTEEIDELQLRFIVSVTASAGGGPIFSKAAFTKWDASLRWHDTASN